MLLMFARNSAINLNKLQCYFKKKKELKILKSELISLIM